MILSIRICAQKIKRIRPVTYFLRGAPPRTPLGPTCTEATPNTHKKAVRDALQHYGSEARKWRAARQKELKNLQRHGAYEPVPEDTLPSWNATKGRANEVVNILDVLKKKYINNVFEKYKARWVFDGRQQKAVNSASATPMDTFAPTVPCSSLYPQGFSG